MMTWKQFAKTLFELEDADPGYMMLGRVALPKAQKQRFMTAWCAFYNPGIAAKASEYEGELFWRYLKVQYATAKRASERRHFRGTAGLNALAAWQDRFVLPEKMVEYMTAPSFFKVQYKAREVPQIGGYFVWKFADVQERVFRIPCTFPPEAAKHSPNVPQQGAKQIAPDLTVGETYAMIADYLNDNGMRSPPWYDRNMNMQEAETVCCVYKQYVHGKWCPHSRTAKATRSLLATPSDTSEALLKSLHAHTGVRRKEMDTWQQNILANI